MLRLLLTFCCLLAVSCGRQKDAVAEEAPAQAAGPSGYDVGGRVTARALDLTFRKRVLSLPEPHKTARLMHSIDIEGDGSYELAFFDEAARKVIIGSITAGSELTLRVLEGWIYQFWQPFGTGDLNGDGRQEIVSNHDGKWFAAVIDDNFAMVRQELDLVPTPGVSQEVQVGDFDCNGSADLVLRSPGWGMYPYAAQAPFRYLQTLEIGDPGPTFLGRVRSPRCAVILFHVGGKETRISAYDKEETAWAHLIVDSIPNRAFVGDFNGDGLSDVLINTPRSVTRWWAAFSNSRTAIETAVTGPEVDDVTATAAVAGDFNGDGLADLLSAAAEAGKLELHLAEWGEPVAGATITIAGIASAVTDSDGGYRLTKVPAGKHTLVVSSPGRRFNLDQREVEVPRELKNIHFLALHPERDAPRTGQVERYGPRPAGPYVCFGYVPGAWDRKWGRPGVCPEGFAAMGNVEAAKIWTAPANVPADISCCRMPSDDILSTRHSWEEQACPSDAVVTGSNTWSIERCESCPYTVRCTKINTERYQLAPREQGRYWGLGQSASFPFSKTVPVDIPAALRTGIARSTPVGFDQDGCIGSPPGSLLVEKGAPICSGFWYRELQYRGAPGDPPAGTPVRMFPECRAVEGIFEPAAACKQ